MTIKQYKYLNVCVTGAVTIEVTFDQPVTEEWLFRFGTGRELSYHPTFARPYFQVDQPGAFALRGIVGDPKANLVLPEGDQASRLEAFVQSVEKDG